MTERIYCSKCYKTRVHYVGEICQACQSGQPMQDDDERNAQALDHLETKPRNILDAFGFGRKQK